MSCNAPMSRQGQKLTIAWANVGKRHVPHLTLLQICFEAGIDVINVQEPACYYNSRTQTHPGFDLHAPVDQWGQGDLEALRADRPRVLTYTKKGANFEITQLRDSPSRDWLSLLVNGTAITNIYRSADSNSALDMVCNLSPNRPTIVGGDFNLIANEYEPSRLNARGGHRLSAWANSTNMEFTGEIGAPTHAGGGVLDLVFSNIPFASTHISAELTTGSDHETLVTSLCLKGQGKPEAVHYTVRDSQLEAFSELVGVGLATLPCPTQCQSGEDLDRWVEDFTTMWQRALQARGTPASKRGRSAPWWTKECQELWKAYRAKRRQGPRAGASQEERAYLTGIRAAKASYWRTVIDGITDDKQLYNIIGWHKRGTQLPSPPLVVDGASINTPREKAETLQREVLGRFSEVDDLDTDPLAEWDPQEATISWQTEISPEEAEKACVGVLSTSPGVDGVTVRLMKACWGTMGETVKRLYQRCLELSHFPAAWKRAEVVMLPKVGKRDRSLVSSWRPIALLSCISKGLERIFARRIAWAALTKGILSSTHGGALPRRSATDLICALMHEIETALAEGKVVTMVTSDVKGAFDALLKKRLLREMRQFGFDIKLLRLVDSFLTDRKARVRFEGVRTDYTMLNCGTPQGSPASPVLFMIYLAKMVKAGGRYRFAYADDILNYRVSKSLGDNIRQLTDTLNDLHGWGNENKIVFAPEKTEMIHITRARGNEAPSLTFSGGTINPITTVDSKVSKVPGLRWLGYWFDRRNSGRRHIDERAKKALGVANHIRSLGGIKYGPPAAALRKAAVTCVLSSATYAAEAWYNPAKRQSGMLKQLERPLLKVARAILPAWRTAPSAAVLRDAGIPSAEVAAQQARLRFALRLKTVDRFHPLYRRQFRRVLERGRTAGQLAPRSSNLLQACTLLPDTHEIKLIPPRYTPGSRLDPTGGKSKKDAAKEFRDWELLLGDTNTLVFTDGSERWQDGQHLVGYGYAAYEKGFLTTTGSAHIGPLTHVFDAEVIGALRGLQAAAKVATTKIWLCVDSTSAIWGLRGDPSTSSQWAFIEFYELVEKLARQGIDTEVKWCPGHQGITGNSVADRLAAEGAAGVVPDPDPRSHGYSVSGLRSVWRGLMGAAELGWWRKQKPSTYYRSWELGYSTNEPPELNLPRALLGKFLAIRTGHGDFAAYHARFGHDNAQILCRHCRDYTAPQHIVHCPRSVAKWKQWPEGPKTRPNTFERKNYLFKVLRNPLTFQKFAALTGCFDTDVR